MEKEKLSENEAVEKIKHILSDLPPESHIAAALRNIVDGAVPEVQATGMDDGLRQVRIPDETLRKWGMEPK